MWTATTGDAARTADRTSTESQLVASVLDHRFKLFGGGEARLADWHGTPMVVNFWTSWRPPCVAEMRDALEPMHRQLGGSPRVAEAVLRSLRVGLIVASGFLIVFGVAGVLLSTGVQLVSPRSRGPRSSLASAC